MDNTPNYYSILPATVRYDNRLKANEKLLYSEITALCNKNGYCWATNQYFSNLYNVHKNTISAWISKLEEYKYIQTKLVYKKDSKQVDKRLISPINEMTNTLSATKKIPMSEKVEENTLNYNNTSINNTRDPYDTISSEMESYYEKSEEDKFIKIYNSIVRCKNKYKKLLKQDDEKKYALLDELPSSVKSKLIREYSERNNLELDITNGVGLEVYEDEISLKGFASIYDKDIRSSCSRMLIKNTIVEIEKLKDSKELNDFLDEDVRGYYDNEIVGKMHEVLKNNIREFDFEI